jgi:hypothetical protein
LNAASRLSMFVRQIQARPRSLQQSPASRPLQFSIATRTGSDVTPPKVTAMS